MARTVNISLMEKVKNNHSFYIFGSKFKFLYSTHFSIDWGSLIVSNLAKMYPNRVKGIHITLPTFNYLFSTPAGFLTLIATQFAPSYFLTKDEVKYNLMHTLSDYGSLMFDGLGYFHLQATKPDTMGHGLADSPVGLLAYILEKYSLGTYSLKSAIGHRDGKLNQLDRDELLNVIMYYWTTNTITSSCRMYRNTFYNREWPRNEISTYKISRKVDVAVHFFEHEFYTIPYAIMNHVFLNFKRFTVDSDGGHFTGFENPVKTANDFIEFFRSCQ
jgi:pimeloyl-ACP methyl ester carboxylesterase